MSKSGHLIGAARVELRDRGMAATSCSPCRKDADTIGGWLEKISRKLRFSLAQFMAAVYALRQPL